MTVGQVDLTKGGPGSYRLRLNGSEVEAEVHTLRDGGLLVQVCLSPFLFHLPTSHFGASWKVLFVRHLFDHNFVFLSWPSHPLQHAIL